MLILILVTLSWLLAACDNARSGQPQFRLIPPDESGVTFANAIATNDSLNVQRDVYVYNGAGVAVGDIDNDGLPDLFFAGNAVSSRLYRNSGHMRFEDITRPARVGTDRWATGATMVDINNDGFLDIYVSVSGPEWSTAQQRANLLFVNNGDRTFTEAAARYGIADTSFTTHAVFLDYDRDGCVDLFLLNNSPQDFSRGEVTGHPSGKRGDTPGSYNQLYRNTCRGTFVNVSRQAGILRDAGYGLGVAVADINRDGWPDIYVSNDAAPNDVLYVNNRDGTFSNKAGRWLKHTSLAGMGVDVADFNDDGWPDIAQVDMMPNDLVRRKRMSGFMNYNSLIESRAKGFRDDYSVNSLQLSNGVTRDGDVIFSDVAHLSGVAATDWSWSPLFADFDNDGRKDLLITNGYPKAVNDFDYQTTMFGVRRDTSAAAHRRGLDILAALHAYDMSNYVFRNAGDLTFVDETRRWGLERPSLSYGAAYADLDNDGWLDLVVSNIDAPALIYHNVGATDAAHHWLELRLRGDSSQRGGLGATVVLTSNGRRQYLYASPYRGYMSTVDDRLHFGLGSAARADSLAIEWADGRRQLLTNVTADRLLELRQVDATRAAPSDSDGNSAGTSNDRLFRLLDFRTFPYTHQVSSVIDYGIQPLLPYMISRQGPPLATGDVDGDGLDDVYVGGGPPPASPGRLFLQRKDGTFAASPLPQPWTADAAYEDWGALFFDANGDGRLDLYVASGAYQRAPQSQVLQDRLYVNMGGGRFVKDSAALPSMLTSTAVVRAADFDGDGRQDLFVGGRLTPRSYPYPTRSYLLHNEGGRFVDVTEQALPELVQPGGMITDAVWIDFDGDGRLDLVTAGEWMPVQFFHNEGGRFKNVTAATGLPASRGWWFALAAGDFDNDGRPDLVAGNFGLNGGYSTSKDSPMGVYAADFSGHQTVDVVLTQGVGGTEYPLSGMTPLGREIYSLGLRYPSYAAFAQASVPQLFSPAQLQRAVHLQADTFASLYLHNEGKGRFSAAALPRVAQIAPVRGIVPFDADHDGALDLVVAGNLYDMEPNTLRADAGSGVFLKGDGRGHFTPLSPRESGFLAPRNVAGLALVKTSRGQAILVANTGDSLQVYGVRPATR